MKNRSWVRIYGLLITVQVIGLIAGTVKTVSIVQAHEYRFLPACFIGYLVGIAMLWRWWRGLQSWRAIPER